MIKSVHLLPHGMQIIPGLESPYNSDFKSLHEAMEGIKIESEFIVLLTPHGTAVENEFLLYNHERFQGFYYHLNPDVSIVNGVPAESKEWSGDSNVNQEILSSLSQFEILELIQGGSTYPMTLAWGETVPLYYIQEKKVIVISIPRRRYAGVEIMQEELFTFGRSLYQLLQGLKETYSIVISGDLAHTHLKGGPYGFSPTAVDFDEKVMVWVKEPRNIDELLELNKTALSCGMAGICILQGIFDEKKFILQNSHYSCPTYFGMIVANWIQSVHS